MPAFPFSIVSRKKLIINLFALLILLFVFILQSSTAPSSDNLQQPTPPPHPSPSPQVFGAENIATDSARVQAKVVSIIDGDTIEVELENGSRRKLRYIGVDTPESVDPRKPVQCFAKEATEKNKELVANKMVELEKDVSETDRYGRLLRYIYVDNLFVNQTLVAEGYAHAVSYPPDVKYQEQFKVAEQQAREENKGLWRECKF